MAKTTTTEAKKASARPKTAPKETLGKSKPGHAASAASGLPEAGKKAPAFSLSADDSTTVSLKALAGRKVVLYFYPKDDTPGCTTEAIAFSALKKKFDAAGAVVIGVSKDTVEKHSKFRDKHKLTVRLLSDEDGKTLEAYGVWAEKSLYGRKFMGIVRTTFLIDEKGVVRRVWPKVKVKDHAEEVLAAVKTL
ncbi:MAG: thioredoxin-dependent thiol peroxidase [Alphaproteobacteria bacterium HGW-Alphaproteobacteria-12]|nr:MAG: thioredoxin-dependent thiol peroxidase [Alphaproteobacteria bacterium HGW-Alphaproteobacteria-12]